MTLSKLIKELQKLEAAGHGREKVVVDKQSLWDGNDSWVMCQVSNVKREWVYLSDEDGGIALTQKGYERGSMNIIIKGNA